MTQFHILRDLVTSEQRLQRIGFRQLKEIRQQAIPRQQFKRLAILTIAFPGTR